MLRRLYEKNSTEVECGRNLVDLWGKYLDV